VVLKGRFEYSKVIKSVLAILSSIERRILNSSGAKCTDRDALVVLDGCLGFKFPADLDPSFFFAMSSFIVQFMHRDKMSILISFPKCL